MSEAGLAAVAVAALVPYLAQAGGSVITTAAGDLYQWLKGKLPGKVEKLETTPEDADRQASLRTELADLLEANPQLAAELRPLVQKAEVTLNKADQRMSNTGPYSKNVQNTGSGSVNIS